jgi:hypothetical protein
MSVHSLAVGGEACKQIATTAFMLAAVYAALGKAIVREDPPMLRQIRGADSIREPGAQLDLFLAQVDPVHNYLATIICALYSRGYSMRVSKR